LEFTGVAEELGEGVTAVEQGQRVFGITGGGAHAEFLVSHERLLVPVPQGLDTLQAAAVPESFITAYDALFNQAGVKPGEKVLVHAAGGGVGTALVQLARFAGCMVFTTTRTSRKLSRLAELGADVTIDSSQQDFAEVIAQQTHGTGVHVCIDFTGGSYLAQNLATLGINGRLVILGLLGGVKVPIDLETVLNKRLRIIATQLRGRPLEEKIAVTRQFADVVVPQIERGLLRSVIDRVFTLDHLPDAHRHMASNSGFGKIVISVEPGKQ
jgi:NADPH:quinone reductase-like Zn-dependent oxidoreductase